MRSALAVVASTMLLTLGACGGNDARYTVTIITDGSSPLRVVVTTTTTSRTDPPATTPTSTTPPSSSDDGTAAAALEGLGTTTSAPPTPYDRSAQFGGWIDADSDCQDTRAEVLIVESTGPVSFTGPDQCRVAAGRWHDPYTGEWITVASSLDVDHLVPLEAAWQSGAWSWTPERRVEYANDLNDADHLVAVTASANRSKGSRGPDEWVPPLQSSHCAYALDWVAVKVRWSLTVTSDERAELRTLLHNCP